MNPLQELKHIAEHQKTVRTSRLQPLLKEVEQMYIKSGKTVKNQRKTIQKMQRKINNLKGMKK